VSNSIPLVSIIVPTHNMAHWISDCVGSVFAQTYVEWECIIVDDGSTDNTLMVVEGLRRQNARLRYIGQEAQGPSSARNAGIEECSGEFVAFIDADDIWLPDKLSKQMELIQSQPDVGLCGTRFEDVDAEGRLLRNWDQVQVQYEIPEVINAEALAGKNCLPGSASAALVPKKCLDEVGHFDHRLRMGEDWDLWFRLALRYRIVVVPEVLVRIRRYTKERDVMSSFLDTALVAEKARSNAPPSLFKAIAGADFNRHWSAFTISCRCRKWGDARSVLYKLARQYPLKSLCAACGKTIKWIRLTLMSKS